MNPTPRTAVIYTRKSTQELQQNTLAAQEERARQYAGYKQIPVAKVYPDAISGIQFDFFERPVVAQMIEEMTTLGATDIIITDLDRGFKGPVDVLLSVQMLAARGIRLHLMDIGLDPTTPVGEMVVSVMAALARFEGRRRSERQMNIIRHSRKVREETGTGILLGAPPYGFDAVPLPCVNGAKQKFLLKRNACHPIRVRIVSGDLSRLTARECERALNAEGIPSPGAGKTYRRKQPDGSVHEWVCDGKWKAATITNLRKDARNHDTETVAAAA